MPPKEIKSITILIADDDPDDRLMTKEALEKNYIINDLRFVNDGEELMNYLRRKEQFKDPEKSPRPSLILLDLNMPKIDGREALKEIKSDTGLRSIPVIVLTTSKAETDILKTYDLGVNCFISKPVSFSEMIDVTKSFGKYWLEVASLPNNKDKWKREN